MFFISDFILLNRPSSILFDSFVNCFCMSANILANHSRSILSAAVDGTAVDIPAATFP